MNALKPTDHPRLITPQAASNLLSFGQEGLWFRWQLDPTAAVYNRPTFLRLFGPLDYKAFERAVNEVTRRHEILRAIFPDEDGKPRQIIQAWHYQSLISEDLSNIPLHLRDKELQRLAIAAAQQPFDLKRGPVMRASLIQLGPDDHVLLLVFHHIVFDAWSGAILINELSQLYRTFESGAGDSLPEPAAQYSDFALWQRRCNEQGIWDAGIRYWKQELSGELPTLHLPIAKPGSIPDEDRLIFHRVVFNSPRNELTTKGDATGSVERLRDGRDVEILGKVVSVMRGTAVLPTPSAFASRILLARGMAQLVRARLRGTLYGVAKAIAPE